MLEARIDGVKKLRRLVEMDWMGRARAARKMLLQAIAERVLKKIVDSLPDSREKWLQVYKKSIRLYEIADLPKDEAGFAIASRVEGDWSMVDAATMIVYFDADPSSPDLNVGEIMEEFSPFAPDKVPNLEGYGARIRIRRVRAGEVEEVRRRNEQESEALLASLAEQEVAVRPGPAKVEGRILFDMPFMVMRMELGFGDVHEPHWRPVLRNLRLHIHELFRSRRIRENIEALFDPREAFWKDFFRRDLPRIRLKDVEGFEEFQQKIRPRML